MASNKNYYPGQKFIHGYIHKIINEIPSCLYFYELYAGSAAVSKIISVGSMSPPKIYLNDINPEVNTFLSLVPGATTFNNNATDILQQLISVRSGRSTFVFIDPPYLHSTRPGSTALYKFEMSESDHIQLLNTVRTAGFNIMITHPDCDLYNTMLEGWRKVEVTVRYHRKTSIENL